MKREAGDPPGAARKLGPEKWPKKDASARLRVTKREPKIVKKSIKKGVKNDPKKRWLQAPFWTTFGSLLGAFLGQKAVRGRPRHDFSAKRVIASKHCYLL